MIVLSAVVLPAPLRPSRPTTSPASTPSEKSPEHPDWPIVGDDAVYTEHHTPR